MNLHLRTALVLSCLFLSCIASAQGRSVRAGLLYSPKGAGLSLQVDSPSGSEVEILNLYADVYGLPSERTKDVGIVLSYTHNYILKMFSTPDVSAALHSGVGATCGYVHDYEKGVFSKSPARFLEKNMGGIFCLCINAGLSVDFERNLTIDLSYSFNPGLHIRTESSNNSLRVSLYKLGFYYLLAPQLSLLYRF